jgi:transposase
VKTDRLDARTLATKAAAGQLKGVAIPTRAQHEQRQVLRTYGQAVRTRKRAQIQIRSVLQEHGRIGLLVFPTGNDSWRFARCNLVEAGFIRRATGFGGGQRRCCRRPVSRLGTSVERTPIGRSRFGDDLPGNAFCWLG